MIIILIFILLVIVYFTNLLFNKKPKGLKLSNNVRIILDNFSSKYNKDNFNIDKIPEQIDVIIIGSGISSLTCAALLSKLGWQVLVLEQHDVAGGSTHSFVDHGFEFDTGIHYVGNIKKRIPILNFLSERDIEWVQLGRETEKYIYDEYIIDDVIYRIPSGEENLKEYLYELFPQEQDNIDNYIALCKKISQKDSYFLLKLVQPKWLANILTKLLCHEFMEMSSKSVYEIVSSFTQNNELIELLCSLSTDGGPASNEQSFFMHASIVNHFLEGGYYPIGGTSEIANGLIPTIMKSGGRVLVNVNVEEILIENNHAVGVRIKYKNKEYEVYAPKIISGCGLKNTFQKLLPEKYMSNELKTYFNIIPPTFSYNFLFLGLNGTSEDLGLDSSNHWVWNGNFNDAMEQYIKDPFNSEPLIFIASNSAKDPTYNERFPNKSTVAVIAICKHDMFSDCSEGIPNKRNNKYEERKELIEKQLLSSFLKLYPHLENNIVYKSTATPESVKYYLGSPNGEVYGMDANINKFKYNAQCKVDNINGLYLTGQDVTTLGFTGALMSGILTANSVTGYTNIIELALGRELLKDLMNYQK